MPRPEKRDLAKSLLSELTEYIPVDNGFLEVRMRYITQQDYMDQSKRTMEAGSLRSSPVAGNDFKYRVDSSKGDGSYLVDLRADTCECPDYLYRARPNSMRCKHIIAARNHFRLFDSNGHDEDSVSDETRNEARHAEPQETT